MYTCWIYLGRGHLGPCLCEGAQTSPSSRSGWEDFCINFQLCSVFNFITSVAKPFLQGPGLKVSTTKNGQNDDLCICANHQILAENLDTRDITLNHFLLCTRLLIPLLPDTTQPKFFSSTCYLMWGTPSQALTCSDAVLEVVRPGTWSHLQSAVTWTRLLELCASVSLVINGNSCHFPTQNTLRIRQIT